MGIFNIVFHGMMIMDEISETEIEVVLPDVHEHEFKYGSPGEGANKCDIAQLSDLPGGSLQVEISTGFSVSGLMLSGQLSPDTDLLLTHNTVRRVSDGRTKITVPKPNSFQNCRTASVKHADILGSTPPHALLNPKVPLAFISEIVIFRFLDIQAGTIISFGANWRREMPPGDDAFVNLCIYSQCPGIGDCDHNSDAFNECLEIDSHSTDIRLHAVGKVSSGGCSGVGISDCQLKSLGELRNPILNADTSPGGCGRGWLLL